MEPSYKLLITRLKVWKTGDLTFFKCATRFYLKPFFFSLILTVKQSANYIYRVIVRCSRCYKFSLWPELRFTKNTLKRHICQKYPFILIWARSLKNFYFQGNWNNHFTQQICFKNAYFSFFSWKSLRFFLRLYAVLY